MGHLAPDDLLDLAEGQRPEAEVPHLATCPACRQQLADVREILARVAEVPVPEPSPLFWEHLSARVREAVAAEGRPRWWPWQVAQRRWGLATAFGMGLTALAVVVALRTASPTLEPVVGPEGGAAGETSGAVVVEAADPSLGLLADLAGDLDWDAAADIGMVAGVGGADAAMGELTVDERAELRRLLDDAMSGAGA